MLKKLMFLFVTIPVALVLLGLTVANRHMVTVKFDPFDAAEPAFALTMPMFLMMFGSLILGVFAGGVATWFAQSRFRKAAKAQKRETAKAQREANDLRDALESAHTALPAPRA